MLKWDYSLMFRKGETMKKGLLIFFAVFILFSSKLAIVEASYDGWRYEDGKWYYYESGEKLIGWIYDSSKKWYYLDRNGVMQTGWVYVDSNWYYLNSSGAMQTGWLEKNGKYYYLRPDGRMAVGWNHINNKWYYFSSNGVMQTGWLFNNGKWYYLQPDGSMATGWLDLNGDKYYLLTDGSMVTGWQKIDGLDYYFTSGGIMRIASKMDGNNQVFLKSDGSLATGWYWLGNAWYYFNKQGNLQTGWLNLGNTVYYLKLDGRMTTKWALIDNHWYYFNSSGAMQTGWQKINNKTYYFKEDGKMATGWQEIENKLYYFNKDGEVKTGWIQDQGAWYYLTQEGKILTGLQKVGNQTYYFDAKGVMQTGWHEINNNKYYFKSYGPMAIDWTLIDGNWYYFNAKGEMQTGWTKIGDIWYYLNPDTGIMQTGWYNEGENWFYFGSDGAMRTGWTKIGESWYYFYSSGVMKTGWLKDGEVWYYFYPSGAMKTGWLQLENDWYYFNSSGAMQTGWVKIGEYYYYFKEDGRWDGRQGVKIGINYTHYDKDFSSVLDIQASRTPKADGAGQFIASKKYVEYYLNPLNFSWGSHEFYQFLDLSIPLDLTSEHAQIINENVLKGMGKLDGQAQAFIDAGKEHNINAIYLIAHAIHETGRGTSTLSKGVELNGKVVYNMFGYGAIDGNPVGGGSQYAYDQGWFTPEDAIKGGAKNIAKNYIYRENNQQNTLYKMRWNPEKPGTHQYATHVAWATIQTKWIKTIYDLLGITDIVFDVPTYNNQPGSISEPQGDERYAVLPSSEGTEATTTASSGLRLREYPVSGPVIDKLPYGTKVNVLGKNGGWYKVSATIDGTQKIGWVSGQYLTFNSTFAMPLMLNIYTTPESVIENHNMDSSTNEQAIFPMLDSIESTIIEK